MKTPKILVLDRVWAICGPHPDDGRPDTFSYWDSHMRAVNELECMRKRGYTDLALNEVDVYYEKTTKFKTYYRLRNVEKIMINPPSRESILAKLTPNEIEFLGLKP